MFNFILYLTVMLNVLGFYMMPIHADTNPNPYDFNVYTLGSIGTQADPYESDIQGIVGSGGNAYFSGFSANLNGPAYLYSVYSGGSVNINSGSVSNGGIEAAGNVYLNSATINGNVNSGGNLQGGNGNIYGNASLSGTNTSSITISGSVLTNQLFTPSLNLSSISNYFQSASSYWAGLAATAAVNDVYNQLQVTLSAGRNIVDLSLAQLSSAYGIQLTGPSNAYVIFNITDATPTMQTLHDVTFTYSGGVGGNDVIYNLPNATQLTLNGGDYLSILAPQANITFLPGLVTGNLIAQSLVGSGQVDEGTFAGFQKDQNNFNIQAPEPSAYAILLSCLGIVFLFLRHNKSAANECN
jgi:choice-of-anchor A domain-containing protein